MKIISPNFEILTTIDRTILYKQIERAARTCYKSEDKITDQSCVAMVRNLVRRQHLAMLEHASVSVKFVCDRGVTHEMVRHRVASYAQESTRYCNYANDKFGSEITVIDISTGFHYDMSKEEDIKKWNIWSNAMEVAESYYFQMIDAGATPQEARSVLPNSTKTEIIVTMNLREWLHFFNLRVVGTTGAPHPQMREAAIPVLKAFADAMPEVFGDVWDSYRFD